MTVPVHGVIGRRPSRTEQLIALLLACILLVAVGVADDVTGEHVLVDAFYLLPILVGTWFIPNGGGMFFAVATTVTWALVRVYGEGYPRLGLALGLWNAIMRFVVMATVAYLLARARRDGFTLRSLLDRAKPLPDVVPICAWCRKLRNETDEWQTLEQFFSTETNVLLTHGVCADCARRLREDVKPSG